MWYNTIKILTRIELRNLSTVSIGKNSEMDRKDEAFQSIKKHEEMIQEQRNEIAKLKILIEECVICSELLEKIKKQQMTLDKENAMKIVIGQKTKKLPDINPVKK